MENSSTRKQESIAVFIVSALDYGCGAMSWCSTWHCSVMDRNLELKSWNRPTLAPNCHCPGYSITPAEMGPEHHCTPWPMTCESTFLCLCRNGTKISLYTVSHDMWIHVPVSLKGFFLNMVPQYLSWSNSSELDLLSAGTDGGAGSLLMLLLERPWGRWHSMSHQPFWVCPCGICPS